MKKLFFTFFVMIFFGNVTAQQMQHIYHFSNISVVQNGDYQLINLNNCINSAEVGSPMIPWQTVSLLLPQNTKAVSVSIEKLNPITLQDEVFLYPMQKNAPISVGNSAIFEKNEALYRSNFRYPENDLGHYSTQYFRGYGFLQTAFSPIEYIPSSRQVTLYQDVIITVDYETSNECRIVPSNNQTTLDVVRRLAQNSEVLPSYSTAQKSESSYDILIITGANFVNQFSELTDMYLKKGLRSVVKSVSEIYDEMTGVDQPEKIRNYIIQEFNENQIEHVILGGDIDVVPYRGFFCQVESSSLYEDDNIPADLYFSALDGTWNDNNNHLWGEIGEDDLLPDISVGRMSFSNANELQRMIHKSVSYQMNPVQGELTKVLLPGELMYDNPLTYGGDQLDMLVGYHDEHGYITDGIPETHDITTLYDRDLGYEWSSYDLMSVMNQGFPFINHAGHSNWNYVMRLSNQQIKNSNFSALNGVDHNYSIIYSHGCIAGAFDENDCIGEMMTKIDNLAVAVFFNSRYGWFNEGQTEGPSLHINREFCDEMYTQNNTHLGTAHFLSKVATAPFVNAPGQYEEGALRWCFYDCNLLGDPVLQMWTDEPITPTAQFDDILYQQQSELAVQTLAFAKVALIIDNQLVATNSADENGDLLLSFPPINPFAEAQLWISGINILPTDFSISFQGEVPCLSPINITANTLSHNVLLTWESLNESQEFVVYRNQEVLAHISGATEYLDENLSDDTYCYQISSVCGDEESAISDEVCAVISSEKVDEKWEDFVRIYPNPATENVQIELLSSEKTVVITLYDLSGRAIKNIETEQKSLNINLLGISQGIYIIQISDNQQVTNKKLVIR